MYVKAQIAIQCSEAHSKLRLHYNPRRCVVNTGVRKGSWNAKNGRWGLYEHTNLFKYDKSSVWSPKESEML